MELNFRDRAIIITGGTGSFGSRGSINHCPKDIVESSNVFAGDVRDSHGVMESMKGCDAVVTNPLNWFVIAKGT